MHFPTDTTAHTTQPLIDQLWIIGWNGKIAQITNASAMQDRSTMQENQNLYSWVLYCPSHAPPPALLKKNYLKVGNLNGPSRLVYSSRLNAVFNSVELNEALKNKTICSLHPQHNVDPVGSAMPGEHQTTICHLVLWSALGNAMVIRNFKRGK